MVGNRQSEETVMAPPTPPMSVTDVLDGAIDVLTQCRDRVIAMRAPVVQPDLQRAVELSRQIIQIYNPNAR